MKNNFKKKKKNPAESLESLTEFEIELLFSPVLEKFHLVKTPQSAKGFVKKRIMQGLFVIRGRISPHGVEAMPQEDDFIHHLDINLFGLPIITEAIAASLPDVRSPLAVSLPDVRSPPANAEIQADFLKKKK